MGAPYPTEGAKPCRCFQTLGIQSGTKGSPCLFFEGVVAQEHNQVILFNSKLLEINHIFSNMPEKLQDHIIGIIRGTNAPQVITEATHQK